MGMAVVAADVVAVVFVAVPAVMVVAVAVVSIVVVAEVTEVAFDMMSVSTNDVLVMFIVVSIGSIHFRCIQSSRWRYHSNKLKSWIPFL